MSLSCRGCAGIVSDEVLALQVGAYEVQDIAGTFAFAGFPVLYRALGDAAADLAELLLSKAGAFAEGFQHFGGRRANGDTEKLCGAVDNIFKGIAVSGFILGGETGKLTQTPDLAPAGTPVVSIEYSLCKLFGFVLVGKDKVVDLLIGVIVKGFFKIFYSFFGFFCSGLKFVPFVPFFLLQ